MMMMNAGCWVLIFTLFLANPGSPGLFIKE
jgi:hypothetical protein